VLGIAGVEGNGQAELVEAIMGLRPAESGRVLLSGRDLTGMHTRPRRAAGIGFIPEDRTRQGLLLEAALWENRILGHQTEPPNVSGIWIDRAGARRDCGRSSRSTTSAPRASRSRRPRCPGATSRNSSSAGR